MYLSKLTVNSSAGCKAAFRDLANPYEMHRTIMRAFPGKSDGGPGRVLFRVEPGRSDGPPVVLVQSERQPDWSALRSVPGYLLDAAWKEVSLHVRPGQRLRFRLRANPTVKRAAKRHGLFREEDQRRWLERKGQEAGFRPLGVVTSRKARLVSRKSGAAETSLSATHLAVDYEGILEVTDSQRFLEALAAGIGPAKGFGFGLLSVAPAG